MKTKNLIYGMLWVLLMAYIPLKGQSINVEQRLQGIDQTIEKILKDWNVPGCGIGIVYKDKLVFAKGYGYRNMEKKLPVTPNTLFQIASNTKLFTATAIGFLVDEGKLDWDKPIKKYVPQIPLKRPMTGNEAPLSNRKAREVLGFKEEHDWRKYI